MRGKRKQLDAVKLAATVAAEAVREAQRKLDATDAKVVQIMELLQEAEKTLEALSSFGAAQTAATTNGLDGPSVVISVRPDAPQCVDALIGDFGDDPEAMEMLQALRNKVAAKVQCLDVEALPTHAGPIRPLGATSSCPGENPFGHRGSARTTPYGR